MKRAVIFAHYDKDRIVDGYVIYYLKALKEISDEIVFVSCNKISDRSGLEGLVSKVIDEEHGEYDFGSYKRGYLYLKDKLNNFDELVFVNDSCYGPFYPLKNVFERMETKDCDFWGITKNNYGYRKLLFIGKRPHIQSYFMVFKKNVFTSDIFNDFMQKITSKKNKREIIREYEIGLSELLIKNGYKPCSFIEKYQNINNIAVLKWRQIIQKCNMPFLKCSVPRLQNREMTTSEGWEEIIPVEYPEELIENNLKRFDIVKNNSCPINTKRAFFDFVSNLPFILRKLVTKIIFMIFPFIKD